MAADRLGVIYTPNEIVRFMIESADRLCEEHFGRRLIDEGVDILDRRLAPAPLFASCWSIFATSH